MKKTIGLFVSLVFLTSFFAAHVQATFIDTAGHWSEVYIEDLVAQGVVSGYENGDFGPDDAVTRGQMAKIVVLAFGLEAEGTSLTAYVNAAVAQGILMGEYSSEEALTRAEAAKMLVLAAELSGSGTLPFTDVSLEDWFYSYVLTAYSNGLVSGYGDGRFGPNDTVTRGQIAKMTVLAQEEDIVDENIVEFNPFTDASFYVDPDSNAYQQIAEWDESRPEDAAALEAIASQPTAKWFGDWSGDIEASVDEYVTTVNGEGDLPVLVAYNIPGRDCGNDSAGGSADADNYRMWIQGFADGVGERNVVVVLEPDALSLDCLYENSVGLLAEAVSILKSNVHISVYIDAGHSNWVPSADMATRLVDANVGTADGFSLNVSNFYTNEENIIYGEEVSALIGGKHFIMDTGRNGNGWNGEWCNPSGRSLGENPNTQTGNSLVDAFLWVKPPGESDGTCNGGPSAGAWWAEYALGLVQN